MSVLVTDQNAAATATIETAVSDNPEALAAGGVLTIDLAALRANYQIISKAISPTRAAAVVKADAYGLGADKVAPQFYAAGCRDFFVAHLSEALKLQPHIGKDAVIYVLNGLQPRTEKLCADSNIVPVLNSLEQVRNWVDLSRSLNRKLPALLQLDTGMSRLGLSEQELQELLANLSLLEAIDVKFIISHLAAGDNVQSPQNHAQLERLQAALKLLPHYAVAFSNSGGSFMEHNYHFDLARPGIALYGGAPQENRPNPMQPVVSLQVRVIQCRTVPANTLVGYGGSYETKAETRIATIAVGYADGWPRHLSNKGSAWYGDVRLPVIGRVSMDSITLDVSALPEGTLKLGSLVELIGPHQTLEQVAQEAGTISYEILTSLGNRYHRIYINDILA
ncbi:alanine racemase [Pseudochrobactrum sp. sp1633]|uniref:alanine racemase n=1 Tax=Pseudochrobactrum sp. sp1633 TaxID=3036706 RepID=UPI0025A4F379|nr:alanine racemase [Pseudochrobactrum sp. sp1633]MDM8345611.1 alanine racemase [Pseudochrobactrum sp. sp1633]HWD13258.1 alanine racemase [Pseudochrobactrum sp.]